MKIVEGRAGKFELAGGLQADCAVVAGKGDDIAALQHGLPAIFGEAGEQIANAAGLVIGGRAMIGGAIDKLLVLRADLPAIRRFLALFEHGDQLIAALDDRIFACRFRARAHALLVL